MLCVTDYIGKMHAAHEHADEPQEITSIVADCLDGTADEAETCRFIANVKESTLSSIRFLLSMCETSPETITVLSSAMAMLDGLSN